MKLYESLADDIAASIRSGVLKPGDRLPSVRQVSSRRHVSAATVFQAYYLLEGRGLIHSRPRSGYFVAPEVKALAPEPVLASLPDGEARTVEVGELVVGILQSAMSRDIVPLGSAFPSPYLFPLPKLGRATAVAATGLEPWATVDDLASGSSALRQQIAVRYGFDAVHIGPEQIVITNGAMEALNLCLRATCKAGDAVIVESPCFYACLQILENMGLKAVEVATDPKEGIDLDALETAIKRHKPAACWVMTNFQNPLGSSMPAEKKRRLVESITRHEVPMIDDDVYAELYADSHRPVSSKAYDAAGWVLHCSSFSKTLAPGYRIGWVSPGRFLKQVSYQKLTTSLATSVPTQLGLARYLEKGHFERHLREVRLSLRKSRDEYVAAISEHFPSGTKVSRPLGGYFLWVELPGGVDALALQREAMASGISLAPGPMFSSSGGFSNCVRVNSGHSLTTRVEAALHTVGRLARKMLHGPVPSQG